MNLKIKFRESFRPFAPCVRADRAHEFFDMLPGQESPYMMFVAPVRADICHPAPARTDANADSDTNLITRVNVARSDLPAITHVDYSARVQTVDAVRHGRFYRLLRAFEERTGCPVLVNTSFNVRGEPIVNTPAQALACFLNTDMDVLVLNNYVITKEAQTAASSPAARQNYLQQFALD